MQIVYSVVLPYFLEKWYKAEKLHEAKAQFDLARLYSAGKKTAAATNAIALYRKSAKQGYTDAQFALGKCYENGYGIKRSYPQAIRWYKEAEHNIANDLMNHPDPVGDAHAAFIHNYFQNEELEQAIDEIMEFRNDADENSLAFDEEDAACGDAEAQNRLGHRYYYGQKVEQSYQQAVCWYRKSAEQGCEAAMMHLAEYYEVIKCYKEAAKWYRKYTESRIKWRNNRLGW